MLRNLTVVAILWNLVFSSPVSGVAYCALRDPVSAIQQFYPDYTSYIAVDGRVDESVRAVLDQKLPGVHFSEFGIHTLYKIMRDERLIGYVHARTEKGDWGLDELIWALSPELRVDNFRYQRSRSAGSEIVESSDFHEWLDGRDVEALITLLSSDDARTLSDRPDFIPAAYEATAVSAIRSAIKTLVITEHVWPSQAL